jgi:hypothetical protein
MGDSGPSTRPVIFDPSQHDERAYPPALRGEEEDLLVKRRQTAGHPGPAGWLSVGLSGGGIRSATFSLGVFQRWASSAGLLRRIDYLSTVSGGGYLGSFLGRLFSRNYLKDPDDVETVLRGEEKPQILRFLRENGRYMAPNGAGDKLLVGAMVLRNWFSVQLVLSVFILTFFLGLQAIRIEAGRQWFHRLPALSSWLSSQPWGSQAAAWLQTHPWKGEGSLWWSPYILIPPVIFFLFVFPLGWAYWLIEPAGWAIAKASMQSGRSQVSLRRWEKSKVPPWAGVLVALALGLGLPRIGLDLGLTWLWWFLIVTAGATLLYWGIAAWLPLRKDPVPPESATRSEAPELAEKIDHTLYRRLALRNRLSVGLTWTLTLAGGLLVLALIDSLGQTMYVLGSKLWGYLALLASPLLVFVSSAQRIVTFFSRGPNKEGRLHFSLRWIATLAALVLALFLLVAIDAASHAIAWGFQTPRSAPLGLLAQKKEQRDLTVAIRSSQGPVLPLDLHVVAGRAELPGQGQDSKPLGSYAERDLAPAVVGFLVAALLSWLFGRTWPFVDRSSHHSLYASRLTRTYLGASNQSRWNDGPSVTQVMPGDDLDMARYWPPPSQTATPLHLINVTINETVDGRSQIQQKDRKGVGMALGPCGLSVGVKHHAVVAFGKDMNADPYGRPCVIYPSATEEVSVFRYERVEEAAKDGEQKKEARYIFRGQPLPLGDWVAISGAAFSTGLGAQTSLGISLLAGFANVRLGRWWDSGVGRLPRNLRNFKLGALIENLLAYVFPVQVCLLDEFLARFPGTARKHWYLSDGGHFENLGGYELIRRRLPLIVIVDAEQDTDFALGGLANLIRKARLDFGAEIEFLDEQKLDKLLEKDSDLRECIGSLEQLRRGYWEGEELKAADRTGLSRAHAALARITYHSPPAVTHLIYIKPTLTGDEPADVLEYHRSHPDFPHESTADQFFDEAQWESYRRLGDHIAEKLLPFLTEGAADW